MYSPLMSLLGQGKHPEGVPVPTFLPAQPGVWAEEQSHELCSGLSLCDCPLWLGSASQDMLGHRAGPARWALVTVVGRRSE